ncbi:MAG: radical SAM protein [Flavobacteriales bacterium]|jgi:pyruvate-formate lyase-activating enzyme
MHPNRIPYMVFADAEGNIFEDTRYEAVGRSGYNVYPLAPEDFIELPFGSDLFTLPGRRPYGYNPVTGEMDIREDVGAVAALNAPAYTQLYMAAFGTEEEGAPTLPLYAYTAVGWLDGKFYTAALRVDPDIRQDLEHFDQDRIVEITKERIARHPENRLIRHLGENCSMRYCCPAARNFFLGRWECPIPVSPACNSNCLGCISYQPDEHDLTSPQDRLDFIPSVAEIVEFTVPHLETAERPIVSFGQGCEGEPLLVWQLMRDAIREIRKHTSRGIINLNTNGSKPAAVEELMKAGLNSIRVSTNSAREAIYTAYYLPNNYSFADIRESSRIVRKYGGWASLNYFTFPGMTDQQEEYEALRAWIRYADLSMIQWRNFNIDPDWYLGKLGITELTEGIGIRTVMQRLRSEFPHLAFGYFNPPEEIQARWNAKRQPEERDTRPS